MFSAVIGQFVNPVSFPAVGAPLTFVKIAYVASTMTFWNIARDVAITNKMSDIERKYRDLVDQVHLGRNVSIFINAFTVVQLIIAVILPDLLPQLLKIWLIAVSGGAIVGILIGLLLSREDIKTTNFFILISIFISGLVLGISIVTVIVKVKN